MISGFRSSVLCNRLDPSNCFCVAEKILDLVLIYLLFLFLPNLSASGLLLRYTISRGDCQIEHNKM